MKRIACIGSRQLSDEQIIICQKIGSWVVQQGHGLHSGNALGADQAYARGGNQVNPNSVHLHLPWKDFEKGAIHPQNCVMSLDDYDRNVQGYYMELAEKHHPAWHRLGQGAQKLMARNSAIMLPSYHYGKDSEPILHPVDLVIALPGNRPGGGGTGQGMRMGESLGIQVINIAHADKEMLFNLCEQIRRM